MTTFDHKTASEQIHEAYKCGIKCAYVNDDEELDWHFISQDLGALMELAIRNRIPVDYDYPKEATICQWVQNWEKDRTVERYADHNNDQVEATRVAIAKALIKKAEVRHE